MPIFAEGKNKQVLHHQASLETTSLTSQMRDPVRKTSRKMELAMGSLRSIVRIRQKVVEIYLSPDEMRGYHVERENTEPHDSAVDELQTRLLPLEQEVRLHDGNQHLQRRVSGDNSEILRAEPTSFHSGSETASSKDCLSCFVSNVRVRQVREWSAR